MRRLRSRPHRVSMRCIGRSTRSIEETAAGDGTATRPRENPRHRRPAIQPRADGDLSAVAAAARDPARPTTCSNGRSTNTCCLVARKTGLRRSRLRALCRGLLSGRMLRRRSSPVTICGARTRNSGAVASVNYLAAVAELAGSRGSTTAEAVPRAAPLGPDQGPTIALWGAGGPIKTRCGPRGRRLVARCSRVA